jgi:ABC-type transport system substrate-binding protein
MFRSIALGLVFLGTLAACSGAAAPSATLPTDSTAAPSAVASAEASLAPTVAPTTAPSEAAVVDPFASYDPAKCMDPSSYDVLVNPSMDWATMSTAIRERLADALEAYEFEDGRSYEGLIERLREPGTELGEWAPMSIWAGEVVIVRCGS